MTISDIAKSFIKNYIAVVLQVAVIVVMFITYFAVTKYIPVEYPIFKPKLLELIILITLGVSVTKSGSWARKICGTA